MPMDWIWGLIGGLLIGSAGALYLLGNGRIMGASGILGGLLEGTSGPQTAERAVFVAALIAVPAALFALGAPVQTNITSSAPLLVIGGLLVGLGTRIGNGCTSGHGVCGISRLSLRGIVATCLYIGAGVVTVTVLRGLI
ncbi:YeeE/YedE family protein [Sulfitobacter guttiformis]|uniref:Uncharacterized protein n=1 Tax=Sulfitobacter guttiformis TaxID=74349 RepID=A0A420DIV9_9RHOB|nr:YeeE/YedE family protein [Sulfitobacter guttiformis]KIN72073.1 YeeE/YedE family protein [Sulfitobacter guttiformis KCTC 32187]RKE94148.1 hypothetical protein C8N30_3257 [Sulfitobacter guttiformis]